MLWAACLSLAQENGGQAPQQQPGGGAPGGQQPGGGQPPGTQPNRDAGNQQRQPQVFEQERRPIYLSGQVRLADGTVPPDLVVIERVCAGVARPEGYTDSRGNFSIQLGERNSGVFMDASVGGDFRGDPRGGISERDLAGCELRANLAGFYSDSVMLGFRHALDNPDVGIIRLRALANVEGYTFSLTTALAPKDARKAFENAAGKMKKEKWAEAEKDLLKAVGTYPKYAVAWHELGMAYQRQKKLDDATRAYQEAIKVDAKFIRPYGQLASLAVYQQKWEDVVEYTSKMFKLNPYLPAEMYFYSAVANYNLQNSDVAEEHARRAAKLDEGNKIARIHHLLGVILMMKEDYPAAAESLRLYLKLNPNGPDVDDVKSNLNEIEKNLAK
jgi:tetratricopeptide (TPR) repeat protein